MRRTLVALCILCLWDGCGLPRPGAAAQTWELEDTAVRRDCTGIVEFRNDDATRIDCLQPGIAWEYDFPHKWYECLTQGGWYTYKRWGTTVEPGCVLIRRDEHDDIHISRAKEFVGVINDLLDRTELGITYHLKIIQAEERR